MPRYVAQHPYTARRDGQVFGPWTPGTEVDLPEYDAQWVNRDSPGCLTPLEEEAVQPPAASTVAAQPEAPGIASATPAEVVPDGTAQVVLDWVHEQGPDRVPARAQAALDAETAKGDQARSTLLATLRKLAGDRAATSGQDRMHRGAHTRAVGA